MTSFPAGNSRTRRRCWWASWVAVALAAIGCSDDGEVAGGTGGSTTTDCATTASSIEQYGITWQLDGDHCVGTFANGDWWVLGPVTIPSITPEAELVAADLGTGICDGWSDGVSACAAECAAEAPGTASRCDCRFADDPNCDLEQNHCRCARIRHGWEVNPRHFGGQAFDDRGGSPDPRLMPELPYAAESTQSLVKAISVDPEATECPNCLKNVSVLTVVDEIPAAEGAAVLRPPYVGDEKPLYAVADIQVDLLPSYDLVEEAPTMEAVATEFSYVQFDHKGGDLGRIFHPTDTMPDYGGDIGSRNADSALALLLDYPEADKLPAVIGFVQYGIDLYHMILDGHVWEDGGGHRPGQKLPVALAAVLLDHDGMRDVIVDSTMFHEDQGTNLGAGSGRELYGFIGMEDEDQYWETLATGEGYKSRPDPYGHIDGGRLPGGTYDFCCVTQPWKGAVLAVHLMPELGAIWTHPTLFNYIDRWVNLGTWAQPDPCAPLDGVCSGGSSDGTACTSGNTIALCKGGDPEADGECDYTVNWATSYGVTYGPDGSGGCILDQDPSDGTGRFPERHGLNVDGGYRDAFYGGGGAFRRAMWDAYRGPACYDGECNGDETVASCPYDCAP
ncbi:MAG: hypothetical protein JRI68_05910 [Deltaproteobacteria bacterium]|nr:hypothetical protein [Deltaproteobacteria bacterium]